MSGVSTRAARAEVAVRLRAQGMTAAAIGERLGVSRSYASALYTDPDGEYDRERKRSYGGVCEVCGATTDGSNGRTAAPRRCSKHNSGSETMRGRAGFGPAQRDLCILIGDGIDRFSDLRDAYEVSSGYMGASLDRMLRHGTIERVGRGRYRLTAKGHRVAAG